VSDQTEFDVFWRGDTINLKEICSMSNERREHGPGKERGKDKDDDGTFKSGPAKGRPIWQTVGIAFAVIAVAGLIGTYLF
jgi:hypothetical protein